MKTECGIFAVLGIQSTTSIPSHIIYQGMQHIQHRGQDSYGLITLSGAGGVSEIKEFGLLPDELLIDGPSITNINGVLGHTRYSTVCATIDKEAIQPIELTSSESSTNAYISFNGNIPDFQTNMRRTLGIQDLDGSSDTYLFRAIWQKNYNNTGDVEGFARYCIKQIPGAYSCVVLSGNSKDNKLVGFRDRYGYKPLWWFRDLELGLQGFVSESCQLEVGKTCQLETHLGYEITEVPPGSIVILESGKEPCVIPVISLPSGELSRCSMETIYFMQDNSLASLDNLAKQSISYDGTGPQVADVKNKLGQQLAKEELGQFLPEDTQVIYVPESSYPLAAAYSSELGVPFAKDVIRKIYNIRSFIESNTEARVGKIKRKFEFAFELIIARDVIIIDDSLVRGNTMKYIIGQLKASRPDVRIHIRIASPVLKDKCWFGIDIAERDELIWWQTGASLSGLQEFLGVASIQYLSVDGLRRVLGQGNCSFCFGEPSTASRRTLEW
jgi:amidophosphoribosyltransferase